MYKNALRVIFDQWPKMCLRFDVEAEIQILKVIYYLHIAALSWKKKYFTKKIWGSNWKLDMYQGADQMGDWFDNLFFS